MIPNSIKQYNGGSNARLLSISDEESNTESEDSILINDFAEPGIFLLLALWIGILTKFLSLFRRVIHKSNLFGKILSTLEENFVWTIFLTLLLNVFPSLCFFSLLQWEYMNSYMIYALNILATIFSTLPIFDYSNFKNLYEDFKYQKGLQVFNLPFSLFRFFYVQSLLLI